jgi:radical SAM enzyme (TIGR01210 family)
MDIYPRSGAARDRFVLEHRSGRADHDPWRYQEVVVEEERAASGHPVRTATIFLTGAECPWHCVMCDLWRYTTTTETPRGAIPAQVDRARQRLERESPPVTHLKLYNAGSFFDPRAVPEQDYEAVAAGVAEFTQVTVESHPSLIGARVDRFLDALNAHRRGADRVARLEVAMGLETVHPDALERLNKRMSVAQFADAAHQLTRRAISIRVFLLIGSPFVPSDQQDAWLLESIDVAFDCGASVIALIPTRDGNGAMEALAASASFRTPGLEDIERSIELAHARFGRRGRLFVDLWDLERFSECQTCFRARRDRLHVVNLEQRIPARIVCERHRG